MQGQYGARSCVFCSACYMYSTGPIPLHTAPSTANHRPTKNTTNLQTATCSGPPPPPAHALDTPQLPAKPPAEICCSPAAASVHASTLCHSPKRSILLSGQGSLCRIHCLSLPSNQGSPPQAKVLVRLHSCLCEWYLRTAAARLRVSIFNPLEQTSQSQPEALAAISKGASQEHISSCPLSQAQSHRAGPSMQYDTRFSTATEPQLLSQL